jgi:hypothetical protein
MHEHHHVPVYQPRRLKSDPTKTRKCIRMSARSAGHNQSLVLVYCLPPGSMAARCDPASSGIHHRIAIASDSRRALDSFYTWTSVNDRLREARDAEALVLVFASCLYICMYSRVVSAA